MSALLEVDDLRVRLGPATIVDGVGYAVEPGEVFGIAGESGSGKTMSVLALMGLLPPGARVEVVGGEIPARLVKLRQEPFTDRLVEKFELPVQGWRSPRT